MSYTIDDAKTDKYTANTELLASHCKCSAGALNGKMQTECKWTVQSRCWEGEWGWITAVFLDGSIHSYFCSAERLWNVWSNSIDIALGLPRTRRSCLDAVNTLTMPSLSQHLPALQNFCAYFVGMMFLCIDPTSRSF